MTLGPLISSCGRSKDFCGVELALGGFEVLDCSSLSLEHLLWLASLETLVGPELMH